MGRIFIAGREKELPPDIKVTTFRDPGGFSFYERIDPFVSRVHTDPDGNQTEHVSTRRAEGFTPVLGGGGWEAGDPDGRDPMRALRQVVHAIVIHHDAAMSAADCFRILLQRGFSTHFMIDEDGHIYQAADAADETMHCSGMNRVAVGIDMNNPAPNFVNETKQEMAGRSISPVVEINGTQYQSYNYTEPQYKSLIALLEVLCTELNIERACPVDESGKVLNCVMAEEPKEFHGIMGHWHAAAEKWDPGPGFDWERVIKELRREDVNLPAIPVGLMAFLQDPGDKDAFAREPEKAALEALKDETTAQRVCQAVCRAIESSEYGGYYPIGVNQTWHGGIHLVVPKGTLIRPLLKGEVVAAHLVPASKFPMAGEEDAPGSNNFVLLRHRIKLPPRGAQEAGEKEAKKDGDQAGASEKSAPENILTVFSLYMHLDGVDLDNPPEGVQLFERIKGHESLGHSPPVAPEGPTLSCLPVGGGYNQVRAMQAGYVGLFSSPQKDGTAIVVTPKDAIGYAGEFGEARGQNRVVHIEVFGDDSILEAMEFGLYGRYLQLGPDEPEATDLIVRSWSILSLFTENTRPRSSLIPTGKVVTEDEVRQFFSSGGSEDLENLRRLVVRHVSEWSDKVSWVDTLLGTQGEEWAKRLGPSEAAWVFRKEMKRYLSFVWLTKDVADHIGLKWNDGLVWTFHPIYFLLWWSFRRSAVRGKTIEAMLAGLGARRLSIKAGVPEVMSDLLTSSGPGEWEI